MRGGIAVWLYLGYRAGWCALTLYQQALAGAWSHDHQHLIAETRNNRQMLRAMFRVAQYPRPELPNVLTLWRGTAQVDVATASRGISWTRDRDTACWFACRFTVLGEVPLVSRADV